jgi:branched-subunit amino acid transport protein
MLRKLPAIAVFLLALAPSAYLAWTLRAMPHLGYYHDDGIYWVSAKSLADGNGYRIASLPGEPFQTKYPPLYPALLATVWKAAPDFPQNLPGATLLAWLLFPPYLAMLWVFLRHYGFNKREQFGLGLVAGLSPVAVVFSFSLMPELLFTALLLASVMLAERGVSPDASRWLAVLAGVCAALAYLTKSVAGPLLLTVPICFALRRQFLKGALFVAAMLPAVAGWQWWASQHVSRSWDLVTLYYTNYLGYQLFNVAWRDLPLVMWQNLDSFLMGAGKLLTFDVPFGSKHLERVVAVAAIAGVVRLAKRNKQLQYPLAALGMSFVLLIWHFTPDQRFVFPLYPLLLAGLWTELKNVGQSLRISWNKPSMADRGAAMIGAGLLAGLAGFVAFTTVFGLFRFLPDLFEAYRVDQEARRPAYEWIARNTPRESNIYAYDDPLVFLYSGRKSCSLPVPPKLTYHNDAAGIDKLLDSVSGFANDYRLDYVLLAHDDFYRDLHERGARRVRAAVASNSAFQQLYGTPDVTIYRYRAPDSVRSSSASLHSSF